MDSARKLSRLTHRYWHAIFFAAVLLLLFLAIRRLSGVLAPVAGALLLSYLLDPLVGWLERRLRLPRWAGTLLLFVAGLLVLAAALILVVPLVARELEIFATALPGYLRKLRATVDPWVAARFGVHLPHSLQELTDQVGSDVGQVASKLAGSLGGVAGQVALRTARMLSAVSSLLLVPIFTFYFLPKFPAFVASAREMVPRRFATWVDGTAKEVDRVLAAWIRGQLTVMAVQAVLYSVGLSVVGVKMGVLIGITTALLAFIPYVGVVVGLVLSALLCLLEYSGPGPLIGVGVVFLVMQLLEGLLLTPWLVGEKVGLGPVGVLLALMLGGNLFGLTGVLLAVPVAAALVVVLRRALEAYRRSDFYLRGEARVPTDGGEEAPDRGA
ncbi:MAG: AI-2E family transporter [Deltaproteobacteria bacterium]|nr:AI-2E family transporter [Deltaproteobacteria bacterium]